MTLLYPLPITDDVALQFEVEGAFFDALFEDLDLLLPEIFPDTTNPATESPVGLLDAWENLFQIVPASGSTIETRRQVLLGRVQYVGGIDKTFFYRLAEQFGYSRIGTPMVNIADGQFPPFRLDSPQYGRLDLSRFNDQHDGGSASSWTVQGTSVTTDSALKGTFLDLKPAGTQVVFEDL